MKSLKRIKIIKSYENEVDLKKSYELLKLLVENKSNLISTHFSLRFGLCTNTRLDRLPEEYVESLFRKWKEFSGSFSYPIPPGIETDDIGYHYRSVENKYTGSYGEARIRLAEYLIKKIKKDLKNLKRND